MSQDWCLIWKDCVTPVNMLSGLQMCRYRWDWQEWSSTNWLVVFHRKYTTQLRTPHTQLCTGLLGR